MLALSRVVGGLCWGELSCIYTVVLLFSCQNVLVFDFEAEIVLITPSF